jgi:hypothetical protein
MHKNDHDMVFQENGHFFGEKMAQMANNTLEAIALQLQHLKYDRLVRLFEKKKYFNAPNKYNAIPIYS